MFISEFQQISQDLILYPGERDSLPSSLELSMEDFCVTDKDCSEYHINLWPLDIHNFFFLMKFITYSGIATFFSFSRDGRMSSGIIKSLQLNNKVL